MRLKRLLYKPQRHAHFLEGFDCGNDFFNAMLDRAEEMQREGNSVTRIVIDLDRNKLIGYYSLASETLQYSYEGHNDFKSAIKIEMFALSTEYRHLPMFNDDDDYFVSDYVLGMAINEIRRLSRLIGISHIVLYSVNTAISFYERNNFRQYVDTMIPHPDYFSQGCSPMYLEL
jgi:hypothetical protein